MPFLPRLLCPGCGKTIHGVNAKEVPPAEKYSQCLRRCSRCKIGASNAKNPAKIKFYYGEGAKLPPGAEAPAENAPQAEATQPAPEGAQPQTPPEPPAGENGNK